MTQRGPSARILLVTATIALGVLLALAAVPTGQAQEGPAWWDEDRPFRVVVNDEGPVYLPNGATGQPTPLLGYRLDIQEALERADWPDAVQLAPDPDSIQVVPYESLAASAEAGDPLPRRVLDPIQVQGSCEETAQASCLVVWDAVPGARAYGLYWAPDGWDVDEHAPGQPPALVGHVQGHEHWVLGDGFENLRAIFAPQSTPTRAEVLSPAGWEDVTDDMGGFQGCDDGQGCSLTDSAYRFLTQQPSTVTVYEATDGLEARAMAFPGHQGPWGTNLGLSIPGIDGQPQIAVWSKAGACEPRCDVNVNGQTHSVRGGGGSVVGAGDGTPVTAQVQAAEPVQAALHGEGLLPLAPRDDDARDFVVPVWDRFTVVASTKTTLSIRSLTTGEMIQDEVSVSPGVKVTPINPDHDLLRVQSEDPITMFSGSPRDTSLKHHQPLWDTTQMLVPPQANVYAIAPLVGTGGFDAQLVDAEGDVETTLSLPSGNLNRVAQGGQEADVQFMDTNAALGAITVQHGDEEAQEEGPLVGQALSVTYPQQLDAISASYSADVVELTMDPSSQFAGAGSTVTFDVDVTNLARGSDARQGMDVSLDLNPVGRAEEMDLEATLGSTTVHLPGEYGASETVPLNMRIPNDASDTVITVEVTAHAEDAPELTAAEQARVSVVTIRDFDLAYADGSTSKTETLQPGGELEVTVEAENTGTTELDLVLDEDAIGDERFETCLSPAEETTCQTDVTLPALSPGETRAVDLRVTAPDSDDEARVDVTVRGELSGGHGPVRSVDATVLVNVPVAAELNVPERFEIAPGETTTFDVSVENLGVQADARLEAATTEGPVQAWLVDEDEHVEELETVLGPAGTDRDTWTETGRLTVSAQNATPGLTREVRFLVELEPGGDLPPYRDAASIPVDVIRTLDALHANASVSPGVGNEIEEPVKEPKLSGTTLGVKVQDAPAGWDIQVQPEVTFDDQGRGSIQATILPPPGEPPGAGEVVIGLEDPIGPGTTFTVNAEVGQEAVAAIDAPESLRLAVGDEAILEVDVENVGNQPLEGSLVAQKEGLNSTMTPSSVQLEPGDEETVAFQVNASDRLSEDAPVRFLDGNRVAGETLVNVTAIPATIAVTEATASRSGDRLLVTATVENNGTVPVHGLPLALFHGDERLETRTLEHVAAGQTVPAPIEWTPEGEVDPDELEVRLDPDGVFPIWEGNLETRSAKVQPEDPDAVPVPFWAPIVAGIGAVFAKRRK